MMMLNARMYVVPDEKDKVKKGKEGKGEERKGGKLTRQRRNEKSVPKHSKFFEKKKKKRKRKWGWHKQRWRIDPCKEQA
jgi:hypothetical protein